ncbi:MAG: ABC transporter permease [Blastocatellia bacterium]
MPEWEPEVRRRLADLQLAPTREAAIVEELSQHLEDYYDELLSGGAAPAEAYRQTLAELSDGEALQRELRRVEERANQEPIVLGTTRRANMIADLWQDLRYGARMLMKQPGFTAIAVITLALGIGANTAMFSFIDAALLKPLAYHAPDRLVMVWERLPNGGRNIPDIPTFQEWRARNQVFSHLAAVTSIGGGLNLTGRERAERLRGSFVSANYFDLLGVQPALGRGFSADEEQAGKERVVVLANRCWRQRFGADPNVVGASVTLNNERYTVIGVLPPHGMFDRGSTEVWLPLVFTPEQIRSQSRFITTLARLKPGVTIEQADAEMKRLTEGLARQGVTTNKNVSAFIQPLRDNLVGDALRKMLLLLMGAVFFILLIACANTANLLLARGATRQQEIAVRAALGARRPRIIRQFLTESALLAVVAGYFGALGIRLLQGRFPSDRDTAQTPPVMVINQSLAKRHWPNRDPIGEQIVGDAFASLSFTIIGVAADLRHWRLEEEPKPEVYVLLPQMPEKALGSTGRSLHFAVRTTNDPAAGASAIRALAAGVDKDQPLYDVRTMEEMYSESVANPRFQTTLFSLFGALALTLAAVGLYGVMAYSVTQRTHEIGVRVALGAQTRDVMKLVMAQGAVFTLTGLAIGIVAAIGLSRYLSGFLYEIKPTDAVTYLAVSLLLGGVAMFACYLPARRAAKVDPMVALRHE